jgi:aspartate beta-hydroxylase
MVRANHATEENLTTTNAGQSTSLIAQADQAMARGEVRKAASLLEVAAQRGRDSTTLLRLATVRRSLNDLPGALDAATAAVELSPRNFLMCLMLGSLREAMGAIHGAQRAYRAACAFAPLDLSFQPAMRKQLEWARRRVAALEDWHKRVIEWDPAEAASPLDPVEERRIRGLRTNVLENIGAGAIAPPVFMIPGLKPKRYLDPSMFEGMMELERGADVIREEFLDLAESYRGSLSSRLCGLHSAERDRGRPGAWSMIPLIRNGSVMSEFASRCPQTMNLAARLDLPKLSLISPSLYFSILEPNSRIAPHTGISNARLILHLPLIVPEDCGFKVGGETRRWEVGKPLVFDDMTTHEAWNNSDRIRVVLIADLWRPELSGAERAAITDLMGCADIRNAA